MIHSIKHYWAARAEKNKPDRRVCPSRLHCYRGADLSALWRKSKGPRLGLGPWRPAPPELHYRLGHYGNRR